MTKFSILILLFLLSIGYSFSQTKIDSLKISKEYIELDSTSGRIITFDSIDNCLKYGLHDYKHPQERLKYDSITRMYEVFEIDTCYIRPYLIYLIHIMDLSKKTRFTIISIFDDEPIDCKEKIKVGSNYYLTLYKTDDHYVYRVPIGDPKMVTINKEQLFFYSSTLMYLAVTTEDIKGLCLIRN